MSEAEDKKKLEEINKAYAEFLERIEEIKGELLAKRDEILERIRQREIERIKKEIGEDKN